MSIPPAAKGRKSTAMQKVTSLHATKMRSQANMNNSLRPSVPDFVNQRSKSFKISKLKPRDTKRKIDAGMSTRALAGAVGRQST